MGSWRNGSGEMYVEDGNLEFHSEVIVWLREPGAWLPFRTRWGALAGLRGECILRHLTLTCSGVDPGSRVTGVESPNCRSVVDALGGCVHCPGSTIKGEAGTDLGTQPAKEETEKG